MTEQGLFYKLTFLALFLIMITACAPIRPVTNPLLDQKALVIAQQAKLFNQHIFASKGMGRARLEINGRVKIFKIAWAAVFPDKIRITFLFSAIPVETIVAAEGKITFVSHTGEHARYSYYSKDPDLKKYLHVPVRLSEMILILLGRLPVGKFDDAYFAPYDPSLSTVLLKQDWKRYKQYLHTTSRGKINGIKKTDMDENLLYDINIIKYKSYGTFDLPVQINIKDQNNRLLSLYITDFLLNPSIKDRVFKLTESR